MAWEQFPGFALVGALLVSACFHPSYERPLCGPNGACPAGLTCSTMQICETSPSIAVDANVQDSGVEIDTPGAVIDAQQICFGTGIVEVCLAALPTTQLTVSANQTISTDVGGASCVATTNAAAAGYCVVAATAIQINNGQTLRGMGTRPLVLVSTSTLAVDGTIDVASRSTSLGAGANSAACVAGTAADTGNSGGGGYGGSFGAKGANGETSDGGNGGAAPAAIVPTVLRGGCPGVKGGGQGAMGSAGAGGGSVALIAVTSISIGGTINASGSGGRTGNIQRAGGPGGGSGGMIVLDSALISVAGSGKIFANGGGGGGGNSTATQGSDGSEPTSPAAAATAGGGGGAGGDGGPGSLGSAGGAPPGNATANGGGGGGGGGAGVIKSNKPLSGAVSPAPS